MQDRLFAAQERKNPDAGNCLRQNCGKSSTSDTQMKCKDKQRIQNNVHHCSDQNREHTCFGKALCGDKHIHAKGKLDENSADSVNVHIIYSVFDRIFTGTEGKKESTVTK